MVRREGRERGWTRENGREWRDEKRRGGRGGKGGGMNR
jgi:hypothetical protein